MTKTRDLADLGGGFIQAGTGAQQRTVESKLQDVVSVKDFGAVGTGNETAKIEAAISADGNVVNLGDSTTYSVQELSVASNAVILGNQSTLSRPASGTTTNGQLLTNSGPIEVRDATLNFEYDSGSTSSSTIFSSSNDVVLSNSIIDGNVTWLANVRTGNTAAVVPSGTTTGLTISDSTIQGCAYTILQPNSSTANLSKIKYLYNYYPTYKGIVGLFNAPATGALNTDILILGNSIDGADTEANFGSFTHWGSFAGHIIGGRLIGNYKEGKGSFFRSEEDAHNITIVGNTVDNTEGHGVEIIGNNVGGASLTPYHYSIGNNVFEGDGVTANTDGISLGITVLNIPALTESVVTGNVTANYNRAGVRAAKRSDLIIVGDHVSADCQNAFRAFAPSLSHHNIMSVDCTTPLYAESGGVIDSLHLRSKTVLATPPTKLVEVQAGSAPAGFRRIDYDSRRYDMDHTTADPTLPASSYTARDLWPLGTWFEGRIWAYVSVDSGNYALGVYNIDWDGTTLSFSDVNRKSSGLVQIRLSADPIPPFFDNGGKLAVNIQNAGGVDFSNYNLQVWFDGVYIGS